MAPDLFYEASGVTLYQGRAEDVLPTLATGSIDVCITDPPYNVGKDYGPAVDDRRADYLSWLSGVFSDVARVVRDGLVFFPGTSNLFDVPQVLAGTGFRVVRVLAVHRREFAGDKWAGGPAMCWEPVVWASKADKPHFNRVFGHWGRDFFIVNSVRHEEFARQHPCPKASDAMRWLVGLFVPPEGRVLDPFAGTGPVLLAARERGASSVGVEISEVFACLTLKRLAQLPLPLAVSPSVVPPAKEETP